MIGQFFGWLGSKIGQFFAWLGNVLVTLFRVIVDSFTAVLDWIFDKITDLGSLILQYVLDLIPNVDSGNVTAAISFMRRAWNTFDVFVPLHEGLSFAVMFFSAYFGIKLVALLVRVILSLIP